MSKRLQVVVDDSELEELRATARREGLTLSEWVRQALRAAQRSRSRVDAGGKLEVIRAASRHSFPTDDIELMLADIERGYLDQGTP